MTITPIRKNQSRLVPIIKSEDPHFNEAAANKVAELVSKMDDDTAEMFAYFTMAEVYEADIAKNQRALQRRINEVALKQIAKAKHAVRQTISKNRDPEAIEYAKVLDELERRIEDPQYAWQQDLRRALEGEISKAEKVGYQNPYVTGAYQFDESDFRRDPRTGRFQAKVNVNAKAKALKPRAAKDSLGIPKDKYEKIPEANRAQYAQEYMQIVNFLNVAENMGDHRTRIRIKDKAGGGQYWRELNGKPKTDDWDPATERVTAVEAVPTGEQLTLAGAAFGLAPALGATTAQGINAADAKFGGFAESWSTPGGDYRNSNDRLYSRTKSGSQFLMDVTPTGSNVNTAARLGRAVGEHGSEAEKVFGPAARKTAYRYRGTEKKPDAAVVREYNMVMERALRPEALPEEDRKRLVARQNRAVSAYKGQKAQNSKTPVEAVKVSSAEIKEIRGNIERAFMETFSSKVSPEAKGAGREVLARHLMDTENRKGIVPDKNLYRLQLESGVTPPSEGFLLDKNGKIVAQAVGYGDDHYLPFNLKNLKNLRGGEYIRTRSVGGPTTEDIYTGLMAGASTVTVVSRSGTFTVDFEDDFKGKRRYNDKAMRMTNRYEKLLDTVQSEEVERNQSISPEVRAFLSAEVDKEFGWADRATKREELKNAITAYKQELSMTSEDEADFNDFFRSVSEDLPEGQQRALHAQMRNDWQSQNEFKFRLNGAGYRDALSALQEQFPYYFKVSYQPRKEQGRIETEKDKGYVEAGANRPTAARAGYFGTAENKGKKFSASHANHQKTKYANAPRTAGEREASSEEDVPSVTSGALKSTGVKNAEVAETIADLGDTQNYVVAAAEMRKSIEPLLTPEHKTTYKILNGSEADFERKLETPEGRTQWEKFVDDLKPELMEKRSEQTMGFLDAASRVDLQSYSVANSGRFEAKPFKFTGDPYRKKADPKLVEHEIQVQSRKGRSVLSDKSYADMSDQDMHAELNALMKLKTLQPSLQEMNTKGRENALKDDYQWSIDLSHLISAGPGAIQQRVEALHRVRALKTNHSRQKPKVGPTGTLIETKRYDEPGSSPKNPIHSGVKVAAPGDATDTKNREAATKILQNLSVLEGATTDDDKLDDISTLRQSLEERLQDKSGLSDDEVSGPIQDFENLSGRKLNELD